MEQSLGASIVYGIKVHGEDEGWPLPYNDEEYTYKWPEWAKKDEDGEAEDFEEQCELQLTRAFADFTEPEPEVNWGHPNYRETPEYAAHDAWCKRFSEAKKRANIDCGEGSLDFHRSGITDYMDVYLGFEVYDFSWSDQRIYPGAIQEHLYQGVNHKRWGRILERAVEALNFQASDEFNLKPAAYLLVTYW